MFKVFYRTYYDPDTKLLSLGASFGLNGEDLFNILPPEVQEKLEELIEEDPEIKQFFEKSSITYMTASKIKDITGLSDDEKRKEIEEITEYNFFE